MQLRAPIRLCDQDFFWEMVDEPLRERLQGLLTRNIAAGAWEPLRADIAASLTVVSSSYARERIPALEQRFATLPELHRMNVVAMRPHPYFVPAVLKFIEEAGSWRIGEQVGQLLVQHGAFLGIEDLRTALTSWAGNSECRTAAQCPTWPSGSSVTRRIWARRSPRSSSSSSPAFSPWPRREIASTGTRRWRRSCTLAATFGDAPHADLPRPRPQRLPGQHRTPGEPERV